jgi:hypothetical protein
MIVIDTKDGEPTNPVRTAGGHQAAHVLSDKPGEAGSRELINFAAEIGLLQRHVQEPGTPREHLDVWGTKLDAALEAGAEEVGMRGVVDVMQKKREPHN